MVFFQLEQTLNMDIKIRKRRKTKVYRVDSKALRNWKISVKALTKQLWKLTIKTKRLSQLKLLSFVYVND